MNFLEKASILILMMSLMVVISIALHDYLGGIGLLLSMPLSVAIGSLTAFLIDYFTE